MQSFRSSSQSNLIQFNPRRNFSSLRKKRWWLHRSRLLRRPRLLSIKDLRDSKHKSQMSLAKNSPISQSQVWLKLWVPPRPWCCRLLVKSLGIGKWFFVILSLSGGSLNYCSHMWMGPIQFYISRVYNCIVNNNKVEKGVAFHGDLAKNPLVGAHVLGGSEFIGQPNNLI